MLPNFIFSEFKIAFDKQIRITLLLCKQRSISTTTRCCRLLFLLLLLLLLLLPRLLLPLHILVHLEGSVVKVEVVELVAPGKGIS